MNEGRAWRGPRLNWLLAVVLMLAGQTWSTPAEAKTPGKKHCYGASAIVC